VNALACCRASTPSLCWCASRKLRMPQVPWHGADCLSPAVGGTRLLWFTSHVLCSADMVAGGGLLAFLFRVHRLITCRFGVPWRPDLRPCGCQLLLVVVDAVLSGQVHAALAALPVVKVPGTLCHPT
jgi:hypothetical protein